MSRIQPVSPEQAKGQIKKIYEDLQKKTGTVFNIFQNMGNSATVLAAFLTLSEAAGQTSLTPKLREQIALIVAQINRCGYCLSAHTAIAKGTGLDEKQILDARKGKVQDAKSQAILQFAKEVVENRGNVSDAEFALLKKTGVTDQEVVEIILVIMVNIFTNYFNHITNPPIDFPPVEP